MGVPVKRSRALLGATACVAAAALAVGPAAVGAEPTSETVVTGLAGPLGLDVSKDGVFVAQNFAGSIDEVLPDGSLRHVLNTPDAVGIAAKGKRMVYTTTKYSDGGNGPVSMAQLRMRRADGSVKVLSGLLAFEKRRNPDQRMTYGVRGVGKKCRAKLPPAPEGKPYKGILDSHPYAVAEAPQGGWYVADAAGNDILHVSPKGRTKVVAVLKPQLLRIPAGMGFPKCAVGHHFAFEAVPTDVEVTKRGALIVSLLPGGPEDPSLGARGSVVKIGKGGKQTVVAKGFAAATDVAIGKRGKLYVTELFGDKVSVVDRRTGEVSLFAELAQPSAVEYFEGSVYVLHDTFPGEAGPDGKLTVFDLDGGPIIR